jgi:hypothetical protein
LSCSLTDKGISISKKEQIDHRHLSGKKEKTDLVVQGNVAQKMLGRNTIAYAQSICNFNKMITCTQLSLNP